jgi:preprotein translocase subunit YajC
LPARCGAVVCKATPRRYIRRAFANSRQSPDKPDEERMLTTPVYAQFGGGNDMLISLLPFILIFVIMYFLILRPQQRRVKLHQEMVKSLRRGDTVVTSGGLVGKITKVVDDNEIEVQIAEGVRIRQMRQMVSEVRAKGEPAEGGA